MCICIYIFICRIYRTLKDQWVYVCVCVCVRGTDAMVRLVCSLKLQVPFAKEPYKTDYILQKRPIILRSLLIEATPSRSGVDTLCLCVYVIPSTRCIHKRPTY